MSVEERGEKLRAALIRTAEGLKKAMYPEDITCDVCGAELVAETRYTLCAECLGKMPFIKGHVCLGCGVAINDEADYCLRCQRRQFALGRNISPVIYKGVARELIYALKFGGKKYLAGLMGKMMSDAYLEFGADAEIVAAVPMTEKERKKRGFNQSELLADEVGKRLGMPVLPALSKIRETAPQKELSGKEREENPKGCFAAAFGEYLAGRRVLLIDDVFTTGATANECARVLLAAGARSVDSLTFAVTEQPAKNEPGAHDGSRP